MDPHQAELREIRGRLRFHLHLHLNNETPISKDEAGNIRLGREVTIIFHDDGARERLLELLRPSTTKGGASFLGSEEDS